MKCKYCGAELHGKSVYCIQCGRKNDAENVENSVTANSVETVNSLETGVGLQEEKQGNEKGKHVSGKKVLLTVASILGVFAVAVMAVLFIRPVNNCFQMVRGAILMNIDEYQAVDAYWTALENGHLSAANKLISHYMEDGEYGMASNVVNWLYGNYREKADSVLAKFAPEKPNVSMEPGTYSDCVDVVFTSDEDDVEIYVSENGGEFILSEGTSYHLNQKETYTYQVYLTNRLGIDSDTYSFEYVMDIPAPADVEVNLTPGTFTDYQMIEMTSPDGSDIYYTLDGTKPTQESALYQEPIRIGNGTSKLVASAIDSKGTWGNCFEGTYEIVLPIPENVTFSVPGGTYPEIFQLTLEQPEGARIYYTTNGTEPSANSILYEGPIDIHAGYQTIKAVAINDYDMPSETVAQDYTVTYNKYGRYPKTAMIGGDYFAVLGANRSLTRLDENLTVSETYEINDVFTIYADDQSLFYLASKTLYIADPKNMNQSKKLVDMEVDNFALAHDCIYFCSLGTLSPLYNFFR